MTHLKVFTAPWCNPCKSMKPALDELSKQGVLVVQVDVDEQKDLAAIHNVRSVPTLKLYKDAELVAVKTGAMTLAQLQEFVKS